MRGNDFEFLFFTIDHVNIDSGFGGDAHGHGFEITTAAFCPIFIKPLMVDIKLGDAGFGHVFHAIGAGRVGDEYACALCWAIFVHGGENTIHFGVDRAAGVADIVGCSDFFGDCGRPIVGFGDECITNRQRRRDFVGRVGAGRHDINRGLHVGVDGMGGIGRVHRDTLGDIVVKG